MADDNERSDLKWAVSYVAGHEAFDKKVGEFIQELIHTRMTQLIPEENTEQFYHGGGWTHQRADGSTHQGSFEESRSQSEVRYEDLIGFRVDVLPRFIEEMAEGIFGAIMSRMYEVAGEAAESVGNVVDGKGKTSAQAFLESLRQIEFGVDRDGHVTMPQLHLHPSVAQKMLDDLNAQGPEFRAEVERVQREKAKAALEREGARLSRYKARN